MDSVIGCTREESPQWVQAFDERRNLLRRSDDEPEHSAGYFPVIVPSALASAAEQNDERLSRIRTESSRETMKRERQLLAAK